MNPWDILLNLFGWALLVVATLGALIILFAVLVGAVRGAKSIMQGKTQMTQEQYLKENRELSRCLYNDPRLVEAHRAGARWGWGAMHRKSGK